MSAPAPQPLNMFCHFCQKPNAPNHCGKCNSVFYCNRDCQVADWKNHKKFCNMVAKPVPKPGLFTMTKSPKGAQISFGYQPQQITLAARDEFEAAVAAVEAAGVEPPPLVEAGVSSIRLSVTALNVPFIATVWLQETQYGPDAPAEIRRVQELATKITGAPHIFHVLMQMAGDKLAPSLSCKSAAIEDQDSAIAFLTDKYSIKGPDNKPTMVWASLGVTHFLYLLEHCCGLDMQLLRDTQQIQDRSHRESDWAGKVEEMTALQSRIEASQLYSAGQDLYELLTELTRRSQFDNSLALNHLVLDSVLDDSGPVRTASATENDSISIISTALREVAFSSNKCIASVFVPQGTAAADKLPYFTLVAAKDVPIQFSTLLTWSTSHPRREADGFFELVIGADGDVIGELSLHADLVESLYSSCLLNSNLLMSRALYRPTEDNSERKQVLQWVHEAAALYILSVKLNSLRATK